MQSLLSPSAVEAGLVALADARATASQRRAANAFSRLGLPHRRVEAFKWSDFRAALREPVPPASLPDTFPSARPSLLPAFAGPKPIDLEAYEIEIANGVAEEDFFAPDGVSVQTLLNDVALPRLFEEHPLALLAAATATRRTDIIVERAVAAPVYVRRMAGAGASASRLRVHLAPGASLTLVESFEARSAAFAVDTTEIVLGEGAALHRYVVQEGDDAAVAASLAGVTLASGARYAQTALALGAKLLRLETRIAHGGADVDLKSASLVDGSRHADVTSFVGHEAVNGRTRQLHKSVLNDRARGVFQGKFHVARGAQKTDAQMQARALLLSEGAEINHKPELEIYADDVQCAHGATAGALDADALFYLRQRGLSETAARAVLVDAFIADVFDDIADPALHAAFAARLRRWRERAS
jgi:Fe-S cluster assembly protein SufD